MKGAALNNRPAQRGIREVLGMFLERLPLIRHGLGLVWEAAPRWTAAWAVTLLIQGVLPAAQVALTRTVVDRMAVAVRGGGEEGALTTVLGPAALIAILWLLTQGLASLLAWIRTAQAELVQDHIQSLIHGKAMSLDLAFFEDPRSYDLMHRAAIDAINQPLALLENVGLIVQNGLSVVALAFLLAVYAPFLPVILIVCAIPGLWAIARYTWREHHWRVQSTTNERRARYYDWMLTQRESAAEMRLFDLGEYHRNRFLELRRYLREGRLRIAGEFLKAELVAGGIAWAGGLAGMGWMIVRAVRGKSSLGDVVMAYQALQQSQRLLRSLLESAGRIYRSLLFLDNLFEFLSLQPQMKDPENPVPMPFQLTTGIRFEEVTFGYPGSERQALRDFSVELPAGRMTAIVGENGAGKSTLIKLLCRLYDPGEGRVVLDGTDLRHLAKRELHRRITVLFQEPVHYHASAAENIAMADLPGNPSEERIVAAAKAAGADGLVRRLPHGYATVLGRWFGGGELSVGEWQRLALARAFLRRAAIIVLDEPTSAMDSWAEADWLGRLREMTAGCTTLVITHRFTTAMRADVIHVMQNGRIVESGTHAGLVTEGGLYARSWKEQMKETADA